MTQSDKGLGKLVAVYSIAPVFIQRAVFTVVLSFLFFMAMMFAYYIRQSLVYFLLASAFLVIYLITMFSWVVQRKNVVKISENGIEYKKFAASWNEIESVTRTGGEKLPQIELTATKRRNIVIPASIRGFDEIEEHIRQNVPAAVRD